VRPNAEARRVRSRYLVSFLVAGVAAALVVAVVLAGAGGGDACSEWQASYRATEGELGGPVGTLQFIGGDPFEQLEATRPEGCATP
jgi:hypothetical protein